MFKELLNKSTLVENKMAAYRILTKNAKTLTSEDLTELSSMVAEVAAMDNVNTRFLIEETVLSLYELLLSETGAPDMAQFFAACSTVVGNLDGMLSETELNTLVDCMETLRWVEQRPITDLQRFYTALEEKIAQFAPGRYCVSMFRRRLLDIIIQVGNFQKMRTTIQTLSTAILSLDEESFEKSVVLNNEFLRF